MENENHNIRESLNLSVTKLGNILRYSRQAMSQKLNSKTPYFTAETLQHLFVNLEDNDSVRAQKVKALLIEKFPEEAKRLTSKSSEGLHPDDPDNTHIPWSQLWVISANPSELHKPHYIQDMIADYYGRKDRIIIYFVPPGSKCHSMKNRLFNAISKIPKGERARIALYQTDLAGILPHMSIFMGDFEPKGMVLLSRGDLGDLGDLPGETTKTLISLFGGIGIGMDPKNPIPHRVGEENQMWLEAGIKLIFDSDEVI
ncbi:MAG: hypothetical protein QNL04_06630 [SAR324 cluster bacterium]|nr:hypothetical protein [SAR324 cluster bacterium]